MKRLTISFAALLSVLLLTGATPAQKIDKDKLDNAARRSRNAAKVLTTVMGLPNETIPRELFDRAKAVAVFPDVDKINLLIEKAFKGYGVVSRRLPGGWTAPAFYGFGMADIQLTSLKTEKPDVIVLFMTDRATAEFEKGGFKFAGELIGFAGPTGMLTNEKENTIRTAHVIVYLIIGDKVQGIKLDNDLLAAAAINPDNNINKAVYGLKGREILAGKPPLWPNVLPTLNEYQNALTSLSKP